MTKLVERALVKDLLQFPRADPRQDFVLDGLIQAVSAEAELICRRKFAFVENTIEYFTSYDQHMHDPEPQFLPLGTYPLIDNAVPLIQFSMWDHQPGSSTVLNYTNGDYAFNKDSGVVTVTGGAIFAYHPCGFRVMYTGGYPVTEIPVLGPGETADPMDDYGVVQIPEPLKFVIARKVVEDYKAMRPYPGEKQNTTYRKGRESECKAQFRQDLHPWQKKDRMF